MAKAVQIFGGPGQSYSFGTVRYGILANCFWDPNSTLESTESNTQITYRTNGTLSNLRFHIASNTENGAITVRSRINGANGNQTVTLTAATTGEFEDVSNSDSITAGDEVCFSWDGTASSAGLITSRMGSSHFSASTNTVVRHCMGTGSNLLGTSAALYWTLAGTFTSTANTVEGHALTLFGTAGTLKNLFLNLPTNTYNSGTNVMSWIDTGGGGLAGNLTLTAPSSSTGFYEDTSNSDSISVGDTVCYYHQSSGRTSGNQFIAGISSEFETTNKKSMSIAGRPGNTISMAQNITRYLGLGGHNDLDTDETRVPTKVRYNGNATYLTFRITSNTILNDGTITLRINAADSALTFTVPSGSTGTFSDTSNSASFLSGDVLNVKLVTGADPGFWSIRHWAICLENTDVTSRIKDVIKGGIIPRRR